MKHTILFILIISLTSALAACSEHQVQATVPEIEFVAYEEQQCPRLKVTNEDEIISVINSEIEAQFQRLYSESNGGNIRTFTSSTKTMLSILLKAENEVSYGTDGEEWSICYDYINEMIVPCGAYLSRLERSYFDVCKNIEVLLHEKGSYEYISIPYLYFDSNSNPILVVEAIEHPIGADPWARLYHYSLSSNSFVSPPWTT